MLFHLVSLITWPTQLDRLPCMHDSFIMTPVKCLHTLRDKCNRCTTYRKSLNTYKIMRGYAYFS